MSASLTLIRDDFSPFIRRAEKVGRNPKPILRALGTTFMSITMGNFHGDTSYRPIPWKAKWDKSPSNLQQSGNLSRSFHLEVTEKEAIVGTPAVYAAVHQYGGIIRAKNAKALSFQLGDRWVTVRQVTIPKRPFFPVGESGDTLTPRAYERVKSAAARATERILKTA